MTLIDSDGIWYLESPPDGTPNIVLSSQLATGWRLAYTPDLAAALQALSLQHALARSGP